MRQLANTQIIQKWCEKNRQKYHCPSVVPFVRNWVREREKCTKDKRRDKIEITLDLFYTSELDLRPDDLMKLDPKPELPSSGCFEHIISANDVFPKYTFANLVSIPMAANTAIVNIYIKLRHAYFPTRIIKDMGNVFDFQVIHELAEKLCINLKQPQSLHKQWES